MNERLRGEPISLKPDAPDARRGPNRALPFLGLFAFLIALAQATLVVHARPQDLVTGAYGMADILRRAWPPDIGALGKTLWPALETVDIALFGTTIGVLVALPLAILAARNTTPAASFIRRVARYHRARARST